MTLLVGPNGSGKSNFLDALRFLVHSMHAPLEQALDARSGLGVILRKLPGGLTAENFCIKVNFTLNGGAEGLYSLTIGKDADHAPAIEEERCEVGTQGFVARRGRVVADTGTLPASTGDRPLLVAFGTLPQFSPVFELIANLTLYAPKPEKMRVPVAAGPGKVMARDGSNAADVLFRLERAGPAVFARIQAYLRSFNPEFAGVSVTEVGGYRYLLFSPSSNPADWAFTSSEVSDGTLRAIGILLAIFQMTSTTRPVTLVGLEEPESNLHPAAAGVLLDALMEASQSVPILASTHSADLLDREDLPVNALLTVALHDGVSIIGPVDEDGKSILKQRLYTAGELLRNNQLHPRIPARQ